MKQMHFKIMGTVTSEDKMILITVVPADMLGKLPGQTFEAQGVLMPQTIYSSANPTIQLLPESIKNRPDCIGMGAAGTITNESWYNEIKEVDDPLGIGL